MHSQFHYHLSMPKSFLPKGESSAGPYFVCSHFLGSPGKAYPSGARLSLHEEIRHWLNCSLSSSAGIIEMYCAIRTLLPLVFTRMPCGCVLLKIRRSPASMGTFTISNPVTSGLKWSLSSGCVNFHVS